MVAAEDDVGTGATRAGQSFSLAEAFATVYDQLRAIARGRLSNNPAAATLQATAVVNEALLRLLRRPPATITDERHLFALAAQAIRHVIIDHVRRKAARGGVQPADPDADDALAQAVDRVTDPGRVEFLLDLDEALTMLSDIDPELRTVVELHCYAGMSHAEIAAVLHASERTVRRRWRFAAALLRDRLSGWVEPNDLSPK